MFLSQIPDRRQNLPALWCAHYAVIGCSQQRRHNPQWATSRLEPCQRVYFTWHSLHFFFNGPACSPFSAVY